MSGRAVTAMAASLLLVGSLFLPSAAQAASIPISAVPDQAPGARIEAPDVPVTAGISGRNAQSLAESLGSHRTGGVYVNGSGRMVVAVTDEAAEKVVRDAGGVAQRVTYSTNTLQSIHTEMDKLAGIPGTSWGVDPTTNQVSVELDSTVDAANTARLKAVTDAFGSAVRVDRIPGKIELTESTSGGDKITNVYSQHFCSIGFNVLDGSNHRYFVTAGHCVATIRDWYLASTTNFIGHRVQGSWPGNDYGVVTYDNASIAAWGTVRNDTQQIVTSRYPTDGEAVKRVGAYSSDLIGQVLLTSTTVTLSSGEVEYGMIKTSNCALGGDSGGPLYDGPVGLGILSAATSTSVCNDSVSNQRSYYQPLQEVLNIFGLHVY